MRKSPYLVSLILLLAATALTLLNIYDPDLVHVIVRSPGPLAFETKYGLYKRCTRSIPIPNSTFLAPSHPLGSSSSIASSQDLLDLPSQSSLQQPSNLSLDYSLQSRSAFGANDTYGQWQCQPFPTRSECAQFGEQFCVLWSTAGYAAQSALVPCLVGLFSLLFIFLHRGQRTARARARRQQWKLVSVTMLIHCILQIISFSLILHVFRTDERFETKGSRLDRGFTFGVCSAVVSGTIALLLTFTGLAARAGKPWAAGKSARTSRRHKRTRSGRVVPVPLGTDIPPEQTVTVGEVEAALPSAEPTERTALLAGHEGIVAGGGEERATDHV
ncbi:hypothetical protein TREMEDRAFT_69815 [Tremella mesenterica DSM 1558]|uniref:uncharacterized protein n=1 Tax=Tremella mesenterica (strain ATCC 24925 / CBS 8224 / DSM 1558 / NBRC 9311 / NRRL Y-6157 / RJB 2259-6 / UBC 559-6) TaxID=578456 RepID=UPI0003F49EDF|nr:uncharacterized protein TREMEDRAFT_69815 [Tremella mesenterica DSM 1558]EIW67364.1 hypothetical protein TREMEDRAFT_69815 [Tremella mesenterica DSM 1558]